MVFLLCFVVSLFGQDNTHASGKSNAEQFEFYFDLADSAAFYSSAQALDYALTAEKLAIKLNDPKKLLSISWFIASIYADLGTLAKSMKYYLFVERTAKKIRPEVLPMVYEEIGEIYSLLEDREQSLAYVQKSYQLAIEDGDSTQIAGTLFTWGIIHLNFEEYRQARDIFQRLLPLLEKVDFPDGNKAQVYCELALAQTELGDFDHFMAYSDTAIHIAIASGDTLLLAWLLSDIGVMYKNFGDTKKALDLSYHALHLDDTSPYHMGNIYETLADIYKDTGAVDSAFKYLTLYQHLEDSLFNLTMNNKVAALQLRNAEEKHALELSLQKKLTFVFLAAGILVLFFLIFYIVISSRNRRLQRQIVKQEKYILLQKGERERERNELLASNLTQRNQQLVARTMELAKYKESIKTLISTLENLSQNDDPEIARPVEKLMFRLQQEFGSRSWWDEFSQWFSQVHVDFMQKCEQLAPKLTPQEKKICAFIKLNMRNKEIAELMQLQLKSVEMYRMNIRKKFNLSRHENLSQVVSDL